MARNPNNHAFTLVELVVVVLVVGIIAAVAVPKMFGTSREALKSRIVKHADLVATSAERISLEQGEKPAVLGPGSNQDYLDYLPDETVAPTIGGQACQFYWVHDYAGYLKNGVYVRLANYDPAMWDEIDAEYDDGDPAGGKITRYSTFIVFQY